MNYVIKHEISPLIQEITTEIPRNFFDACKLASKKNQKIVKTSEWALNKEKLGKILGQTTKKFGVLTPQAKKNLELFYNSNNIVEVAHQPKFLGGERFILNKLACGGELASQMEEGIPLFYIANYDQVHNELTKTHFPLINSPTGFSVSIETEIERCFAEKCIDCLPLPSISYVKQLLKEIEEKYLFSINATHYSQDKKNLLHDRVKHSILLLKRAYLRSDNYTDWFVNIVGELANIIYDYGYLFIVGSDPKLKQLLQPHYETLLDQREVYIQNYNQQYEKMRAFGINPPLRKLPSNFVPFYYECSCDTCHQQRVHLFTSQEDNKHQLTGICESCKEKIHLEFDSLKSDLTDIYCQLTPRVDTRQYLISKSLQPTVHIAGTGETKYYMQSLPVLKRFDPNIVLPVIYFYNKTTINTFITRDLEQQLISPQIPDFITNLKALMKPLGEFNKLVKNSEGKTQTTEFYSEKSTKILLKQNEAFNNLSKYLQTYQQQSHQQLHKEEYLKNLVDVYLANMKGTISRERSGQESVFHWLDAAIKNGLNNILQDYRHIYHPWIQPGLHIFI